MAQVARYKNLAAYEWQGGYEVRWTNGDQEISRWIGDGVDWFFDDNDDPLWAGSSELHAAVQTDLEASYDEWLEAYFPEVLDEL